MQLSPLGVSNYCKSSLSLMSVLPWWLVLWYNTEGAKQCAPAEELESLVIWVCMEVSERCGMTKLVFGYG